MIFQWVIRYSYLGIFSCLVVGIVGLPIPDEALLTFAGYLVHKGQLRLLPTILAAFLGSMVGITTSYVLGRTLGFYLLRRYGSRVKLSPERLDRVRAWVKRRGKWALIYGYFLPGLRHLTAYMAGASKLELPVFALFAYSGGFFFCATYILLGYVLGDSWEWVMGMVRHELIAATLVTFALIAVGVFLTWRRRAVTGPKRSRSPRVRRARASG